MGKKKEPRTIRERLSLVFWSGLIGAWSLDSLMQDAIGQEAYLHRIEDHWVSAAITVPIAITTLTIAIAMYVIALDSNDTGEG